MIRHDSTVLLFLPVTPDSSPFKNDSAADLLRCPGSRLAQAGLSGPRRPFLSPSGICLFPDGYSSQPQPLSCFFSCCIMVAFSDAKDKPENANPGRICTFRCIFSHISEQMGLLGLIFRKKGSPFLGLPMSAVFPVLRLRGTAYRMRSSRGTSFMVTAPSSVTVTRSSTRTPNFPGR